jgi:hypothetical protein
MIAIASITTRKCRGSGVCAAAKCHAAHVRVGPMCTFARRSERGTLLEMREFDILHLSERVLGW